MRLVGGATPNKGQVEVYRNGFWGTICNDGWDIPDASVVCRMLGYAGAWTAGCCTQYRGGTGPVWLSDLSCTGRENSLSECGHSGWGINNCDHRKDAEVVCHSPTTGKPSRPASTITTMIQASLSLHRASAQVSSTPVTATVRHTGTLPSWSLTAVQSSIVSPSSAVVLPSLIPTKLPEGKKT